MKIFLLFIYLALSAACSTGISLETVDYTSLFTDSNSKVWMVNKLIIKNIDMAPDNKLDKDVIVFHENGSCDYIAMKNIARKLPRRGSFTINSKTRKMSIEFRDKEKWDLDFVYLTEDSVLMEPNRSSDINASLQIIPFPTL